MSVDSILQETSGSGLHVVASVSDPSEKVMSLLQQYPFLVHSFTPKKPFLNRFIPGFYTIVRSFKNVLKGFSRGSVCIKDTIAPEIRVLHSGKNHTRITTYRPSMEEIKKERGVPYMEHPYNPMYRRAVINSKDKDGGKEGSVECQRTQHLKEALQFVMSSFPHLQYLLLVEARLSLSPDFVSYFKQTIGAMKEDPSLYCISASNPLASATTSGDPTRVYRYDHFVGGASLLPQRVVEEIVKDFIVYESDSSVPGERSALESLEVWLSWWGRRWRRGCVVPDVPRVCSLSTHLPPSASSPPPPTCSHQPHTRLINTSRLLHYKYSQDLYWTLTAAEPLGGEVIDCRNPNFFPQNMNASIYIIYIKMENYDDDFTFHQVMKCLGLDLPAAIGYFEGMFRITFRGKHLLLMGIPYSRFSPSIKNNEALLVADITNMTVHGQTNYLKHKDKDFKFDTVLVKQATP